MDYLHLKLPKIKTHLGHELDLTSSTDVSRKRERNICAIEATLLLPSAAVSAGHVCRDRRGDPKKPGAIPV